MYERLTNTRTKKGLYGKVLKVFLPISTKDFPLEKSCTTMLTLYINIPYICLQ